MSGAIKIICGAIGIAAIGAGSISVWATLGLHEAVRLQAAADAACRCERSGGASCDKTFEPNSFAGDISTPCAPISTTSRMYGGHEIVIRRDLVGLDRPFHLCSREEANAAERAFYRAFMRSDRGQDYRAFKEQMNRALRDIVAGKLIPDGDAPGSCTYEPLG